jgi:hypothetical protein
MPATNEELQAIARNIVASCDKLDKGDIRKIDALIEIAAELMRHREINGIGLGGAIVFAAKENDPDPKPPFQ